MNTTQLNIDALKARSINFNTYNGLNMIPVYIVVNMIKKMKDEIITEIIGGRIDNILKGS